MEYRRTSGSQIPERGYAHIWNHQNHNPHMHLGMITENDYHVHSVDNTAVSRVNSMGFLTNISGQNDYAASSFNLVVSSHRTANLGMIQNHYLGPSSNSSFHSNHIQHAPSYYNQYNVGSASNTFSPVPNNGRPRYKRRNPAMPQVYDREYPSGYHVGTTSNGYVPSDFVQPNHVIDPQSLGTGRTANSYRSVNLVDSREGFQRNVRRRFNHTYHLEPQPVEAYSSSNIPPHFHSTNNESALHVGWQHNYPPESVSLQRRNFSSDLLHPYYERNHPSTGINVTSLSSDLHRPYYERYHPSTGVNVTSFPWRDPNNSRPLIHWQIGPAPYEPASSRQSLGIAATTLEDASQPHSSTGSSPESVSRQGRNFSSDLHRPYERYHPRINVVSRETNVHNYNLPRASSFGHPRSSSGSINDWNERLYDPVLWAGTVRTTYDDELDNYLSQLERAIRENDMRTTYDNELDNYLSLSQLERAIRDNYMGYEEVLVVGETIGNVNTGVPEDLISSCLTEMVYRSSNYPDEEKCAICWEEYCDGEKLVKLKCEHDFHPSCIKEWLRIKNDCPMCKAPCF